MRSENEIAAELVDICFHIHKQLGPGLLESAYEDVLAYELSKRKIPFVRQVSVPIRYEELTVQNAFRADLIVESKVIVELKSVEALLPVHKKQLITYLKLTNLKLGLLVNFSSMLFKNGIIRIANQL
jgi:GxxExxY protein